MHSAGVQDRDGAKRILSQISRINRIENVLADVGYSGKLQRWFHRKNKGNKRLSISKKLATFSELWFTLLEVYLSKRHLQTTFLQQKKELLKTSIYWYSYMPE